MPRKSPLISNFTLLPLPGSGGHAPPHARGHHAEARSLTLPGRDPESHDLTGEVRSSMGLVSHAVMRLNCTLAGRLIRGPAITMLRLWAGEFRRPADRWHVGVWSRHVIGVAIVLG